MAPAFSGDPAPAGEASKEPEDTGPSGNLDPHCRLKVPCKASWMLSSAPGRAQTVMPNWRSRVWSAAEAP